MINKNLLKYAMELKGGVITRIDYSIRIEIERQLYITLNQFTLEKFGVVLSGLNNSNQKKFIDLLTDKKFKGKDLKIVNDGFELFDLIESLSSSDPYIEETETKKEQEKREIELKLLSEKIERFVSSIQDK